MEVVLEHHGQAQTGKPPGSLLTDEASLCFRLGYYPLLYLHLIKVHFVKYNYQSMICLLYKKRKWVLSSPEESTSTCKHGTGLSRPFKGHSDDRWTVDTAPHRECQCCTLARVATW